MFSNTPHPTLRHTHTHPYSSLNVLATNELSVCKPLSSFDTKAVEGQAPSEAPQTMPRRRGMGRFLACVERTEGWAKTDGPNGEREDRDWTESRTGSLQASAPVCARRGTKPKCNCYKAQAIISLKPVRAGWLSVCVCVCICVCVCVCAYSTRVCV